MDKKQLRLTSEDEASEIFKLIQSLETKLKASRAECRKLRKDYNSLFSRYQHLLDAFDSFRGGLYELESIGLKVPKLDD